MSSHNQYLLGFYKSSHIRICMHGNAVCSETVLISFANDFFIFNSTGLIT